MFVETNLDFCSNISEDTYFLGDIFEGYSLDQI